MNPSEETPPTDTTAKRFNSTTGHAHEKREERLVDFELPETWGLLRGEVLHSTRSTTTTR